MNALLLVSKEKRQLKKAAVTKALFIFGRSSQCDLVLDDEPMASRQHAEITRTDETFWIQDKGSRNGTLLNGKPLAERTQLNDGDEIDIGATQLKFILDRNQQDSDEPLSGATRVMEFNKVEGAAPGKKVVTPSARKDWHVQLTIVEGPFAGGKVTNWEPPLLIGRGLDNHIVLLDDAVSIYHARITGDGDHHILEDLDSSNGTFVDGIKVKRTTLESGQRIKIGLSSLVFKKSNLAKQRQLRTRVLLGAAIIIVVLGLATLLKPADVTGKFLSEGEALHRRGDLVKAMDAYQSALKVDENSEAAKAGIKAVTLDMAARESLAEAEQAAGKELYDKAKELCYQVLRNSPNNAQARGLVAVIKSIENAKVAFSARNWGDAVALLEKARDTFPKSALVRQRLEAATRELEAQQNLLKAKECLQHQQIDMAETALRAIPESSVYFIEARECLDNTASNRKVAEYVIRARAKYQKGLVSEALVECDRGLQASPANSLMLGVRDRIRQVEPLIGSLAGAEAMDAPDDVPALGRHLRACESLIQIEDDPLNVFRKRAVEAKKRLGVRLAEVCREDCAKAEAALQGGDQKAAFGLYKLAVQADTNNTDALQGLEKLQKKMTAAARSSYQKGLVHEELGQADLARQAFKMVLELSAPGEEYYVRASRKLKDYAQ
ncbi:MAG: FHA domain-containing protein [bacterium]